jgi:hypothetical protein
MPLCVVDLAPLLCVSRMTEWHLLLLVGGLLLSSIPMISCIDLLILLLLLLSGPLVT